MAGRKSRTKSVVRRVKAFGSGQKGRGKRLKSMFCPKMVSPLPRNRPGV